MLQQQVDIKMYVASEEGE